MSSPYLRIGLIMKRRSNAETAEPAESFHSGKAMTTRSRPLSTNHFTLKLISSPTLHPESRRYDRSWGRMNTLESFDRLDLDDDQLFNHEIDSISTIESLATINQRQGLLPFDEQS